MEIIDIANEIDKKIGDLEVLRKKLKTYAEDRAIKSGEYDKEIALTLIALKNGQEFELEGEKICNPPATTTEKIARGICWKDAIEKETSDGFYKALLTNINVLQAQLNGLQSIYRHLSEK